MTMKDELNRTIGQPIRMNLQMFAEDGGDGGDAGGDGGDDKTPGDDEKKKELFDQSEVDRRISKAVESALTKQREKFEAEKQAEIEKAKKEAEEYSKLTEREKLEKDLEAREKQIAEREEEIRLSSLQADVEADLKENGLPTSFAKVLIKADDAQEIKDIVKDIKASYDEAVKVGVEGRLSQDAPRDGNRIQRTKNGQKSTREIARENRLIKN